MSLDWRPVPGFPQYEVSRLQQVRRVSTGAYTRPYTHTLRPREGLFVDFWISGQRHAMSLEIVMAAAFKQKVYS